MLALAAAAIVSAAPSVAKPPAYLTAAVSDPARPADDVKRDDERKPLEMLEFAGVKPGQTVGDWMPGGGYFTRIFSKAVGPKGKVFAIISPAQAANAEKPPAVNAIAADPAYANVTVTPANYSEMALPAKLDVIWTSQNYHDLHLTKANQDVAAIDKAVFAALKPGGVFIVLDHAAAAGTGLEVPDQLHRINPEIVRKEAEAAGFRFEGESGVLRNPADNHARPVFDPAIRGHTDQFIYKFRKPG
jgi:predicted methyltransferase